jgi:hypothetical protein
MYLPVVAKAVANKRALLGVGLLMGLILVLSGCGSGAQAQGRKIPENNTLQTKAKPLPPGKYVSDEFRPAMSFRLREGWSAWEPAETAGLQPASQGFLETRNSLTFFPKGGELAWIEFMVAQKVYKVVSSYEVKTEPAPEDMVSWLQNNPNLEAENPEPVSVGGVKGREFDAVPSRVPQDYYGDCRKPCLPLIKSTGFSIEMAENDRARFIVLDDVEGKRVTIGIIAPAVKFDEFLAKAQKVLDTVQWGGS